MPAEISASRAARAIVGIEHGHDLIANAARRGGSLCSCEIGHASSSLLLGAVRRGRSSATSSDRSLREREGRPGSASRCLREREGRPAHWYRARSSHLFRALARFDLRPTLSQLPRTLQRRQRLFPSYGQTSKQSDALLFHSAGPRKACRRASPLPRRGPAPGCPGIYKRAIARRAVA
jgi:hypothetical protein